jgi:hypothetical protein
MVDERPSGFVLDGICESKNIGDRIGDQATRNTQNHARRRQNGQA